MKYVLKTKDEQKCPACGNKEFKEKKMSMGGEECWCYICEDCGYMMSFMQKNKEM